MTTTPAGGAGTSGQPGAQSAGRPGARTRARPGTLCPLCLETPDWSAAKLVRDDGRGGLEPQPDDSPLRARPENLTMAQAFERTKLRLVCPAAAGAATEHTLPIRYLDTRTEPLIIGVVGQAGTGKSHLLATMIHRLKSNAVATDFGLSVRALDAQLDRAFSDNYTTPLIGRRQVLAATRPSAAAELANAFEITPHGGPTQVVVFFDISGDQLGRGDESSRFMMAVRSLIFVVDPASVGGFGGQHGTLGDPAFEQVQTLIDQVRGVGDGGFLRIPTAIVVGKSDRIRARRGQHLVNRYTRLHTVEGEEFDLRTVEAESEDVYTLLEMNGGGGWLTAMNRFVPTTLHLASATGVDPDGGEFPADRFGQHRVLKPLLVLLGEHGLLGPEAQRVLAQWRSR